MKSSSNSGYKLLLLLVLLVGLINAAARGYRSPYVYYPPDPSDTDKHKKVYNSDSLKFPIYDKTTPVDNTPRSMDLHDPANIDKQVTYSPDDSGYYFSRKLGDTYLDAPTFMSFDDYQKYQATQQEQDYWKRRMDALTLFNKKPKLPTMYKEGLFDRIFGGNTISVRPQGNVDVTFGGNWQNIKNPTLPQRAQKYGIFDFDMQMNINLLATVGDKLKLNISNNTQATFDFQNIQRLEYTGKEDEIIKKIEAGNVSFPLNSSLIQGVQSLFGLKTQLQFGKLWVTSVLSQQRSKRQSLTIQGGSQTQTFSIKADEYEENRHFLLSQYFRSNYNKALSTYPVINSQVQINKIEVWITNSTGSTEGVRNVVGLMDLGEATPYNQSLQGAVNSVPYGLPDNYANQLYTMLQQNPSLRTAANSIPGLESGKDFSPTQARKLNPSEYTYNAQLGYISLNTQINPYDVLAVAFRYTYNGKVYQVGEFAEDLAPTTQGQQTGGTSSANQPVLFLKLLKGTAPNPQLPIWNLMMKNVYALGGLGVSKDNFRLNVLYQDPGGGEKRYIPEGPSAGIPLITLLNLDRLNAQNDPAPDGIFDFVEGITINTQQGKIIFPVLEPFGDDLRPALGNTSNLERKYIYSILYDSTKTVARQFQQNNRYVISGSYKSASSSEIFLGGFNIPQGSVSVTAGGQKLVENVDYQIDYGLGRLKILNTGILNSGIPINVQYEDNATFGFQTQNFIGTRLDYFVNDNLILGGTYMRLTERPFTQKTTFGEDPIKNTVLGLDANYQSEAPGLTRILDKLPIYSTTAPSLINLTGEVAGIFPGHPQQINTLDPEGAVYIDDFEGTRSSYDMKFPATAWTLASTPVGATNRTGNPILSEGSSEGLDYGKNRARLAWYFLEPTLVDPPNGTPGYIANDPQQHYIRLVQQNEVFPQKTTQTLQNALSTLDLAFYPTQRGPYNFDVAGLNTDGTLANPTDRWGGIMRSIDNSDFEQANVEFIEFWVMDPFINQPNRKGGSLYINLGNISEDVLKDGKKFFENGIPYPKDPSKLDRSIWGYAPPSFQPQITRAFDSDPSARTAQDVGYDGLDNEEERKFFAQYLNQVAAKGVQTQVLNQLQNDPAGDDYKYFRDPAYDNTNVTGRYKFFNNPHGNSPVSDASSQYSQAGTNIPESEDINRDNTLNTAEDYYQYRLDMTPNMQVGSNYIVNKIESNVKLPNGRTELETWYQFKIPIREYDKRVGNISDFRSVRFIRLFLNDFQDSVVLRFARFDLGRNNWRRYLFSLKTPGENIPEDDLRDVEFSVTSVSLEENSDRQPIPYVIPPGVTRQNANVSNGQNIQLNEQALSLQVCGLKDGDARAVFKEVNVDMRQFKGLRMFIHAESRVGQQPLKDGDVRAIIRVGSDFVNNYYEYQVPLKISPNGSGDAYNVWPEVNNLDLILDDLVAVKTARNNQGLPSYIPYSQQDSKGNTIVVVGNPNIGDAKTMMLGIANPEMDPLNPGADDGLPKCAEVWFNELRMTGLNEKPGYAASGKVSVQLADLGNVNLSGSMHTQGYGNIDQRLNDRYRDNFYQYNGSTNLNMGKLMPRKWGVQLPVFFGYSENVSNPQYDPYDLDVTYQDKLNAATTSAQRDSLRKVAQDYMSVTSVNLSNVRILGNPDKQNAKAKPWSVKNFDLSYSYNKQFKRNSIIAKDELVDQKLGLGYTYAVPGRSIEPFKKMIKSKSRWLSLIKDLNFNPLPSNFTFRTDLNRIFNETQVRNIGDGLYEIPSTFYKNFTWRREYRLRWELTRSLSFEYGATNNSRIDEPYGKIDSKEKRDSLINKVLDFGRNTAYTQNFNATYNVPFTKLPATDWLNMRLNYGATYNWVAASRLAYAQGNTVANTQTRQVNGELNFRQLYNKQRWLKAVNQPKPARQKTKDTTNNKNIKDLRPNAGSGKKTTGPRALADDELIYGGDTVTIAMLASRLSDQELDSVKRIFDARKLAQKKADKEKRKRERKQKRLERRNKVPEVSDVERVGGRLLTMAKRTTFNYTENSGTTLPGYMDSTRFLGINNRSGAPGFDFIYGYQPDRSWLETQSALSRLSTDSLFNGQFQQQYSQNLNLTTTLEPIRDLRIDVTLTRTFSKTYSELYKDTTLTGVGDFTHNNPYASGSFSISYIGLSTMFKSGGTSGTFQQFLNNREIVSARLGQSNPYNNNTRDPNNPDYYKGYTEFSQDVLIPSFIAAYTGVNAKEVGLVKYDDGSNIRFNPFGNYRPKPNWRATYNGLTKIPLFRKVMNNFVVNHAYSGTMSMNSFVSTLFYQDVFNIGFPSFIDSNSGNFVPFYQVPNITISEQLNPLIGFDASFKSNLTARFEYRKTRTVSLSLIDYQVSETRSTEYVFGLGYRVRGLVLPFEVFGVKKLNNDLNVKVDIGLRDDKSTNNYLAQEVSVVTRGQRVITISPSVDYIVSDKLTLRFFYDRRQSIPYVTSSYPITTTRAGVTLRFIFAQ